MQESAWWSSAKTFPVRTRGDIYCESEEDAQYCAAKFREALTGYEQSRIFTGLSHGCSEYGLKHPEFKYSASGNHRTFVRPVAWDTVEDDCFNANPFPEKHGSGFDKDGISVRDVFGFRTWIDYAEIVGDETSQKFRARRTGDYAGPFAKRAKNQASVRRKQMDELLSR
jgi:hypothetical protein